MTDTAGLASAPRSRDPHPPTAELARATATEIAAELADGRTTSVALVTALLERIRVIDGPGDIELNAVLALAPDALDTAARLDAERAAGQVRGPLHGVPVLIKDNIEALGLPGTAGSMALASRTVVADADLVTALRDAGLIVLGATNLSEWANLRSPHSTSGWSAYGGLTGNPWALDRSAGGSSSGSGAAIAAGLAPLAIGSETDGSIVCPSSFNGSVGIKPTVGLVSTVGVIPLSASQDSPGPMARSVADLALLLDALTGGSACSPAIGSIDAAAAHLGVAAGWLTGHQPTDDHFVEALRVLEVAGITLTPVEVQAPEAAVGEAELHVLLCETKDGLDAHLAARPGEGVRSLADVLAFNEAHAEAELAHFGQEFFALAEETGGAVNPTYADARARCLAWALDTALVPAITEAGGPDFLVAPAYAPACKADLALGDPMIGGSAAITAAAIAGWPILCIPTGTVAGLPVGLVVVARAHDEARLLAVGHVVEAALGLRASGALTPAWHPVTRG